MKMLIHYVYSILGPETSKRLKTDYLDNEMIKREKLKKNVLSLCSQPIGQRLHQNAVEFLVQGTLVNCHTECTRMR